MATKLIRLPTVPGLKKVVLLEVQTAGTNGGTATSGSFITRTLNTLEGDSDIVSLSSNQFTIQPGSYFIRGQCPASFVGFHKCLLYNITTSANASIGTSASSTSTDDTFYTYFYYRVDLTVATTYEVRHRVTTTKVTTGFGIATNFSADEVYTCVDIIQLAGP